MHHQPGAKRLSSVSRPKLLLALTLLLFFLPPDLEAQTIVQNDTIVDFGQAAIQAGFVAQEMAGAWLTSPCDGSVTAVRIIWLSLTGGAPNTLGEWVRVFEEGSFPVPGAILADLPGPVMTDGFANEFILPAPIAVSNGQTFVVGFKFLTAPPAVGPSLVTDTDGCQAGRNGIFAIPPNLWFSSCTLGVTGDFGIRAVVTCGAAGPFFADGFESGDTSSWSATVP